MHWPCIHGLAASAGVQLRGTEREISATLWSLQAWEGLFLLFLLISKKVATMFDSSLCEIRCITFQTTQ